MCNRKGIITFSTILFSIDHPTLNRFYSFHYTLPFLLAGLSIVHIAALHQYGSTNPLGVNSQTSSVPFGTYFTTKDGIGFLYLALAFCILVFFYPEYLGLFLGMAVMVYNNHNYCIAVCWNNILVLKALKIYLYFFFFLFPFTQP